MCLFFDLLGTWADVGLLQAFGQRVFQVPHHSSLLYWGTHSSAVCVPVPIHAGCSSK